MTVAPASARRDEQKGAATACSTAMTVIPSSGNMGLSLVLRMSFFGEPAPTSPGHARISIGARHAKHMLGHKRQDEIGRDRRDLVEPRLAEFALDVIFFRKAKSAMCLDT